MQAVKFNFARLGRHQVQLGNEGAKVEMGFHYSLLISSVK